MRKTLGASLLSPATIRSPRNPVDVHPAPDDTTIAIDIHVIIVYVVFV